MIFKRLRFLIIPLLSIFILGFSSCQFRELELVEIKDVKITSFKQEGIEIELEAKVRNPNNYAVSLTKSDLEIFVNGDPMGHAKIKNNLRFPGNSEKLHSIKLINKPENLLKTGLASLFSMLGGGHLNLQVKGTVKGRAGLLAKKIDVDFSKRVKL